MSVEFEYVTRAVVLGVAEAEEILVDDDLRRTRVDVVVDGSGENTLLSSVLT